MAAKAIEIQSRKRKSKRIRAANKFLSNISLDGKGYKDKKEMEITGTKQVPLLLDEEEIQLISNQSFVQGPLMEARPKLLTSFSTTDAVEENKNLELAGSVSCTSTFHLNSSLEHACLYNRATSLKESKYLPHNNIVCTSGRNLIKQEGQLCGKRVILCSGHHVPFAVYSTLKYTQHNKCSDSLDKVKYKLQRLSDEHGSFGIKGIDIGSKDMQYLQYFGILDHVMMCFWFHAGRNTIACTNDKFKKKCKMQPVSYGHLLVRSSGDNQSPRNILSPRKNTAMSTSPKLEENRSSANAFCASTLGSSTPSKLVSFRDYYPTSNYGDWKDYDPYLLDDPELRSGRHRKVLRLSSFMVSIIEYVKPSQLKKDLNEQFKEKFPNLEITLSKLRSLKQDVARLSIECSLDYSTVAYSIVYFEKLVLWGKISKANRKLVVGSCLLLAAKFNSDLRKEAIKQLIDHISDWSRVNTKDLLLFEIQALIALEFNLHILIGHVLPHLKRLEFENNAFMWKY